MDKFERFETWLRDNGAHFQDVSSFGGRASDLVMVVTDLKDYRGIEMATCGLRVNVF